MIRESVLSPHSETAKPSRTTPRIPDLAVTVAGLEFIENPPEAGLDPYRRAFLAPAGHVGIPFESVEPR